MVWKTDCLLIIKKAAFFESTKVKSEDKNCGKCITLDAIPNKNKTHIFLKTFI